jgi:hypothetical protein
MSAARYRLEKVRRTNHGVKEERKKESARWCYDIWEMSGGVFGISAFTSPGIDLASQKERRAFERSLAFLTF